MASAWRDAAVVLAPLLAKPLWAGPVLPWSVDTADPIGDIRKWKVEMMKGFPMVPVTQDQDFTYKKEPWRG